MGPVVAPETRRRDHSPSFESVFAAHAPYVLRLLGRFGVPPRDVEDVAQEVFLVVHRKLHEFRGEGSLRSFVYGICLRTASDFRRRAHVRREITVRDFPAVAVGAAQEGSIARRQHRELLSRLVGALDDDKRSVFVLYEIEGLPMTEVAAACGCSVPTAYARHTAARKALARAIERIRKTDPGSR